MMRRALAVAAVLLPVAACATRRAHECKAVKAAVARAFPAASASANPAPAVLAKRYARLARDIRDIDATDPDLRPELDDYANNAEAAAHAADRLAKATKAKDRKRIGAARPDVERVARREDEIAHRIEVTCNKAVRK